MRRCTSIGSLAPGRCAQTATSRPPPELKADEATVLVTVRKTS